jgi:hypothetical protein
MVKSFATYDCKSVHGYCPTSTEGSLFVLFCHVEISQTMAFGCSWKVVDKGDFIMFRHAMQ